MEVTSEWLVRSHMPQVLAIESASFEYPWCKDDFVSVLRQRNCIGYIVREDKKVVAFTLYELHKGKLDILNLAVHPDHRRQGYGRQLVERLIDKLSQQQRHTLRTTCWERNLPAQLFFRALGFRVTEIDRSGYPEAGRPDDDSYVMEYRLRERSVA